MLLEIFAAFTNVRRGGKLLEAILKSSEPRSLSPDRCGHNRRRAAPSGTWHGATMLEDEVILIDIFAPIREDFLTRVVA